MTPEQAGKIEAEANELYPEILPMNRGIMSYDELDEHNFQMEDKRLAYIAGRSKGLEREKEFAKYLETIDKSNLWLKEGKFVEIFNHWIKHIYNP